MTGARSIPCDCGARATLRSGEFGPYYACERFCGLAVGADKNTLKPKGPLVDNATRDARKVAHEAFDRLWRDGGVFENRSAAYAWLAKETGLDPHDAHIGNFDQARCYWLVAKSSDLMVSRTTLTGSRKPTPWRVWCSWHGDEFPTQEQYDAQMSRAGALWACPICAGEAQWDDDWHETGYEDYLSTLEPVEDGLEEALSAEIP